MLECTNLQSIDLSNLTQLVSIGDNFLDACLPNLIVKCNYNQLKLIKLTRDFIESCEDSDPYSCSESPYRIRENYNTKIESGYKLYNEDKTLCKINLDQLKDVTIISNNFLNDYNKLTSIDLSPLSHVYYIGNNFLRNCSKLIDIDLTPLKHLYGIGPNFLDNCDNLKSIKMKQSLIRAYTNAKKILTV
jgi:hypothetical protein